MVCISTKLTAAEVEYILKDCGAKVFVNEDRFICLKAFRGEASRS